jgi:hypothetical protein
MKTEGKALEAMSMRRFAAYTFPLFALVGFVFGVVLVPVSARASCPNSGFRVGASAGLSDCRAYEQVSPEDKGGFAAFPANNAAAQVSSSGEAIAYIGAQAFSGAVGNTAVGAGHVSTRAADWHTNEWTPKVPGTTLTNFEVDYAFSPDLSQAVLRALSVPLSPGATPYAYNLFLRDVSGSYSLVNSKPPALPPEAFCGPEELVLCHFSVDVSAFAGVSSDYNHILLESNAQFTPDAPPPGTEALYEQSGGEVRLVGILPDNAPASTSTAGAGSSSFYEARATKADRSVARAFSQDGSHVIFQAPADGGLPDTAQNGQIQVYDRINHAETIEISQPAEGATPAVTTPQDATFQTASLDGSRIFFTSSADLTSQSNTGPENNSKTLYEYNVQSKQLTDLTLDANPADTATGPMVQGVIDSSTDGSYVYFVADGQLSEGKGVDGQPNLYMVHEGSRPVFIATLLAKGGNCSVEIADACVWSPFPAVRQAYITSDGRHMAFISSRSIPTVNFPAGYDNLDQETGNADTQVYEYTAPTHAEGTGQLFCASCDPSGAPPVGPAVIGGEAQLEQAGHYNSISTAFYHARALSENGRRLFYAAPASLQTSFDSVYEFEQNGEGTCESPRGCENLISEPGNTGVDVFLGASADGSNVYFATTSRLVATDVDSLRDVYDARVDGGISTPPVETPCEAACHSHEPTAPALPPDSLAAGLSENLAAPPPPSPPPPVKKCTRKGYRLSHGKCVKLKQHAMKRKKAKRATATSQTRRPR